MKKQATSKKKKPAKAKAKAASGKTSKPRAKRKGGRVKGSTGSIRVESLWPALGDETKRRQVGGWFYTEGMSQAACVRRIQAEFGIVTNEKAVKFFCEQFAFPWKVEESKEQAQIEKGRLPADYDARTREALAQRKFVAVFEKLTHQQLVAFERLELEKQKIELRATQVFLAERRQTLSERKAGPVLEKPVTPALPDAEEARRIRDILGQE